MTHTAAVQGHYLETKNQTTSFHWSRNFKQLLTPDHRLKTLDRRLKVPPAGGLVKDFLGHGKPSPRTSVCLRSLFLKIERRRSSWTRIGAATAASTAFGISWCHDKNSKENFPMRSSKTNSKLVLKVKLLLSFSLNAWTHKGCGTGSDTSCCCGIILWPCAKFNQSVAA